MAVVWTVYLVVTHKVGLAVGIPIILVALLVSLWSKSPWRRQKIRVGQAIVVFVVTATIMTTVVVLSDLQPVTEAKNNIVSLVQGLGKIVERPSQKPQAAPVPTCEWAKDYPSESYRIVELSGPKDMMLKTIRKLDGTGPNQIQFTADCVPCVINFGYELVGTGVHKMLVSAWKGKQGDVQVANWGVDWIFIDEKDDYTIKMDAVGVEWWLKIGVQ